MSSPSISITDKTNLMRFVSSRVRGPASLGEDPVSGEQRDSWEHKIGEAKVKRL